MSPARGRANHELYLARILLTGWRDALAREEVPTGVLAQAYLPGARQHLVAAYGWFLLAISQAAELPARPPRCCADLPEPPAGKVFPAEIREFRQLEADGWLGELLTDRDDAPGRGRRQDNLAVAAVELPGCVEVEHWAAALEALFERMGDSLDEY